MAETSAGTVRVDIIANASDLETQITKAKSLVSSMGPEFEKSYAKMSAAQKRATNDALKFEQRIGMSTDAVKLLNVAARGAAPEAVEKLRQSLLAAGNAAEVSASKFNKYGLTAGQQAMALRGVPAQVTDIVTSLTSGQRPLTVLLQQGGQLKDMFGGVVPAARALGGAVLGMINPFTLTAGAIAALAVAYEQGAAESEAFNRSLILTGGYAGQSVGQLSDMSRAIGAVVGTTGKAADALNQVVATGKISGNVIQDVATAAVAMNEATGQAIQDTIKQFVSLGDAPSSAVLKLNDSQHFLTATIYEQISALEEQGNKEDAATLAQKTYANALKERADEVVNNVGYMERAWKGLSGAAKGAWDAMLNLGRPATLSDKLRDVNNAIAAAEETIATGGAGMSGGGYNYGSAAVANAQKTLATLKSQRDYLQSQIAGEDLASWVKGQREAVQKAGTDALAHLNQQLKSYLPKKQQRDNELAQLNKDIAAAERAGTPYDPKKIEQIRAGIEKKYADKPHAATQSAADRMLDTLRQQQAEMQAQLGSSEKMTSAEQALVKFNQQIADLKGKAILTADQKSLLAGQDAIRAQLQKNVALSKELQTKKDLAALDQRALQIDAQMASARDLANERYQRLLNTLGLGDKATQRAQEEGDLFKEFRKRQDSLAKGLSPEALQSDAYKKESAKIQDELQRRLAMQKNYYGTVDELQASWVLGASQGMANYSDTAMDAFKGVGSFADKTFSGMEDVLTGFFQTGKLNATDFVNYVEQQLIRLSVQQSFTGPLANLLGGSLRTFGAETMASLSSDPIGSLISSLGGAAYSAKGNVYDSPSLSRYANQIHDTPKIFAFAQGVGVFGEAGPEAIMPLKRGPDGRLGVQARQPSGADASGGQNASAAARQVAVYMTINTPDANSFRKSQSQIARELGLASQRAIARN